MRTRCSCPNRRDSKYYHDKGVKVCDEWSDFMCFVAWFADEWDNKASVKYAGLKWDDMEVDRIDGNGDYCPSNCRLVTHRDNCRNMSKKRKVNSANG